MPGNVQYSLKITVCEDAVDATRKGFDYVTDEFKPISIKDVVVIKNGTERGQSTVDLVLQDEAGQKYVVLLSGALLRNIPTQFGGN